MKVWKLSLGNGRHAEMLLSMHKPPPLFCPIASMQKGGGGVCTGFYGNDEHVHVIKQMNVHVHVHAVTWQCYEVSYKACAIDSVHLVHTGSNSKGRIPVHGKQTEDLVVVPLVVEGRGDLSLLQKKSALGHDFFT